MVGDHDSHHPCRCAQHGPILGAVTFSDAADTFRGSAEIYRLLNETQSMVEDFVAGLAGPEDDAATVVELVKRGESWHISIRAGELYCENAEPSWEAAVACVARILGEKPARFVAEVKLDGSKLLDAQQKLIDANAEIIRLRQWLMDHEEWRTEMLASLPPCRIDDPEALAKLTPSRVRAYLKGKGWTEQTLESFASDWIRIGSGLDALGLRELSLRESRSAAAVYLDILAAEPSEGYAP